MGTASRAESPRWSSSEPVHYCLRDLERTRPLLAAIARTVRPGDTVVDAGTGSGILALAAARAGALRVFAIEIDPLLAACAETTAAQNGVADRITVIHGNALGVPLPGPVDVVIAELIDTGLLDELQVPVLNDFHARGVIGPQTRLIPERYVTFIELVSIDNVFYDFTIVAPVHDWPIFQAVGESWHPIAVRPLTARRQVIAVEFRQPAAPRVERDLTLVATADGLANGVRLSGVISVAPGISLGPTVAMNGDTILLLPEPVPLRAGELLPCRVSFAMGGGLGTFAWRREG
jgi:hypothetical protein